VLPFLFQYYYSSIKTNEVLVGNYGINSFNTIIVRLKPLNVSTGTITLQLFQYYYSSIKTKFLKASILITEKFQYYYSSIKTICCEYTLREPSFVSILL